MLHFLAEVGSVRHPHISYIASERQFVSLLAAKTSKPPGARKGAGDIAEAVNSEGTKHYWIQKLFVDGTTANIGWMSLEVLSADATRCLKKWLPFLFVKPCERAQHQCISKWHCGRFSCQIIPLSSEEHYSSWHFKQQYEN